MLSEGKPLNDEIEDNEPKYYRISIHDPSVSKLTIQMTTIHGDPDMFVSRKTKEVNMYNYEKRSIRCGIFPEIVVYERD